MEGARVKLISLISRPALALTISVVTTSACATASAQAPASVAKRPTIRLERTSVGRILVNQAGYTLYMFTRDSRNRDNCAKVPGCLDIWPALTTTQTPIAGPNLHPRLLGTIKFHGKLRQVTYAGHPLYTYAFDTAPRSTLNIGLSEFGGIWPALNAAGKQLS
jgi:predicted lipoprotein with Yx(FWY)xxD motif